MRSTRRITRAAGAAAFILAPMAVRAQAPMQPSPPPPVISVSGTGEVQVNPDRATIYIGVQSRATTAAAASADNARRQHAILDTLRALGFTSDQLSTMNYNVSPQMASIRSDASGEPHVVAYVVTNTVRVDVRKLDDVSRAIDASLAKGANEISGLEFYSSKADVSRRLAMTEAVANARADAEALAEAAGGTLGPLLDLSNNASMPIRFAADMRMSAAAPAATPIEPGQQTLSATVTARWVFVPHR